MVCQPDSGEQALEIADTLVASGTMDVIVIDSVAALVPKAELEGEMGALHLGAQARLMSQALRKLTGNLAKTNKTALIFINQIRHKIGNYIVKRSACLHMQELCLDHQKQLPVEMH